MSIMQEFNPIVDGWYFENWGEHGDHCIGSCEFSWDLFRRTYLGINPTHDCVEAPLDCAFYELFKNCAQQGNCGGMSLLALAVFKYGGYMGFCGPAWFYTGTRAPDREDLHRAINILQARQFSAPGIENFINIWEAGNINNADAAFNRARELLGQGDYPVLSIAKSTFTGEDAHTVIPYRLEENPAGYPPGTKVMYIWDPNYPHDDHPGHYSGPRCRLVISSAFDWIYDPKDLVNNPVPGESPYEGAGGGWCFAIPMSLVLRKARQPMTLDMLDEALMSLFVSGPGAAASQISDDEGRRFYTSEEDVHLSRLDLETDPDARIPGLVRWPWYAQTDGHGAPGELYFMRHRLGAPALTVTVSGTQYKLVQALAGNLVEIEATSATRSRDAIRVSGLATGAQSVEIKALGKPRKMGIRQVRVGTRGTEWRSIHIKNVEVPREGLVLDMIGDLEAVDVSSEAKEVEFDVSIEQRFEGKVTAKEVERVSTRAGEAVRVVPVDWRDLGRSDVRQERYKRK